MRYITILFILFPKLQFRKANTPLEVLNLAYNRIEDDGAVALAEAVAAYNTNLTT